ncbi:MAG: choice-of-anchor D domain-containing protein [Proteobacteria bacterium]|nr:choice-of-anchor D domain-containing protein [Pseudomonadota bacterium]MCP4921292.1 choice-of-anchor D domain-containing protein [Pseudomonadota bacterium]
MLWGLILSCLFCSNRNEPTWETGVWWDSGDFWGDSAAGCEPWISLRDEHGSSIDTLDFGMVGTTEEHTASLWIHNKGDCELHVDDVDITAGEAFSVSALEWPVVDPGDSVELPVTFTPVEPGIESGTLHIESDDPFDPELEIGLVGELSSGGLEVDTDSIDVGVVLVGCTVDTSFTVTNVGSGPVTVDGVAWETASDEFSAASDTVPVDLASGTSLDVVVRYEPADAYEDVVYVRVTSNDPSNPELVVTAIGQGSYDEHLLDEFVQSGGQRAFLLSAIPVENTLDVRVEGVMVSGWSFDGSAVVFDEDNVPNDGAAISVEYAKQPNCEE